MAKVEAPNPNASRNIIAFDTIIVGKITTKGDFRIDGTVDGEIVSDSRIIIGNEGKVKGSIKAANIDVMGSVEGEIVALDTLSLKSSGKINGNITTNILEIEQKAEFNGTCQMGAAAQPKPTPSNDNKQEGGKNKK